MTQSVNKTTCGAADYLGLKSPIAYQLRNEVPSYYLKYGMNFACGGTGLFAGNPNMTTQIDFFEQLIEENVYNASDLNNSLALLSALGNDYFDYLKHGSIWVRFIFWCIKLPLLKYFQISFLYIG